MEKKHLQFWTQLKHNYNVRRLWFQWKKLHKNYTLYIYLFEIAVTTHTICCVAFIAFVTNFAYSWNSNTKPKNKKTSAKSSTWTISIMRCSLLLALFICYFIFLCVTRTKCCYFQIIHIRYEAQNTVKMYIDYEHRKGKLIYNSIKTKQRKKKWNAI